VPLPGGHADLTALRDAIASGAAGAEAACAATFAGIRAHGAALNAYHETFEAEAMARARQVDEDRAAGRPLPPLAGVTVAVKDNICTVRGRTTCSSRMLEGYRSPFDATAVERLEGAGVGSQTESPVGDLHDHPRGERHGAVDPPAVHERAVGAAEIADDDTAALDAHRRVERRGQGAGERDVRGGAAAEGDERRVVERDRRRRRLAGERPLEHVLERVLGQDGIAEGDGVVEGDPLAVDPPRR